MRKYSLQHKFQYFLFTLATLVQLFLIFKYDPGNILSKFITQPSIGTVISFIFIVVPFMGVPILIISATVVHVVDNLIFLKLIRRNLKEWKKEESQKKF